MLKLTKAQSKNQDRINAWLNQTEFKEYSKSKPAIPDLSIEDVLDTFVPDSISDAGAYFTPEVMAEFMYSNLPVWGEYKIIDPCAGIGNLLYPFVRQDASADITAIELARYSYSVGKKLFPNFHWIQGNAYELIPELEGQFDAVLLNPPYNVRWATGYNENTMSGLATKSEHMFVEIALRLLKPNGWAGIIGTYNLFDRMPKKFSEWTKERIAEFQDFGELDGEFQFTKIRVHGYMVRRNEFGYSAPELTETKTSEQEIVSAPIEIITSDEIDEKFPLSVVLSDSWINALIELRNETPTLEFDDRTEVIALLNGTHKDFVKWIKSNNILWGMGYFNGFVNETRTQVFLPMS